MKEITAVFTKESRQKKGLTLTGQIQSPVDNPTINAVLDKLGDGAREKGYFHLYSYTPVICDVKLRTWCWTCREFGEVDKVYGGSILSSYECPKGHEVSLADGKPWTHCRKGEYVLRETRAVGPELAVQTYECTSCGDQQHEALD